MTYLNFLICKRHLVLAHKKAQSSIHMATEFLCLSTSLPIKDDMICQKKDYIQGKKCLYITKSTNWYNKDHAELIMEVNKHF